MKTIEQITQSGPLARTLTARAVFMKHLDRILDQMPPELRARLDQVVADYDAEHGQDVRPLEPLFVAPVDPAELAEPEVTVIAPHDIHFAPGDTQ